VSHDNDRPDFLAHHWETPEQQFNAGKLGMWLFLATEVLLFGGLFVAYAVWRHNHPEIFAYGSQFLDTTMGAINTAVLLLSSMTMAMGVTFIARGKKKATLICLVLTLMGAAGFMVIKYFEYSHKFHEGFFPGLKFYDAPTASHLWVPLDQQGESHAQAQQESWIADSNAAQALDAQRSTSPAVPIDTEAGQIKPAAIGPGGLTDSQLVRDMAEFSAFFPPSVIDDLEDIPGELSYADGHAPGQEIHLVHPLQDPERPVNAQKFFTIYFMMTGLHGIHVIGGGLLIIWLIWMTARGRFGREYYTPVDLGGLYWHIVDVIWIFLFPLFYLI
jgi:cytochrome c oxidase subunit 3